MGKRKGRGGGGATRSGVQSTQQLIAQSTVSLREEATGKLKTRGGARNPKSFLRLDHLRGLALWATKEESPVPPLAAFFGRQYASASEALGAPPDPNLVSCQRCETILHPGGNCTLRIEKVKRKARRRSKKPVSTAKNNVVYKCHFCSHSNLKRGTSRDHMKAILPQKQKSAAKANPGKMALPLISMETSLALPPIAEDMSPGKNPATPATTGTSLLDAKRKKRNRNGAKKSSDKESNSALADSENPTSASQKRKRRKSWTSLKEIVETTKKDHFPIPFFM